MFIKIFAVLLFISLLKACSSNLLYVVPFAGIGLLILGYAYLSQYRKAELNKKKAAWNEYRNSPEFKIASSKKRRVLKKEIVEINRLASQSNPDVVNDYRKKFKGVK